MKKTKSLWEKNQIFFAIIIAAFIIGVSIYFSVTSYVIKPNEKDENFIGSKMVTKIIDGDTVIVEGMSVRLLGIDADEKGYPCYEAAKERLEELVLNKEVLLEKDVTDKDQYDRYLRYILIDNKNTNLQLVEEGLAIARFSPENIKYKEEIIAAEKEARENKIGCKWSGIVTEQKETTELIWSKLTSEATGLDVVGACNAGNYIGIEKIVEGYVADAYKSKTNTVFLNLEKPYPNQCFTAVIFSSDLYKFPENPENYYENKLVRVKGKIQEYEGKPEIILKDLSQIEVGKEI